MLKCRQVNTTISILTTQENYERPTSTRPDPVKPESPLGLGDKLKIGSLTPSMAGLGNMFRKASSFLGFSNTDSLKPPPLDGEIIYSKNNVCVHPPAPLSLDVEHHPGYLTIRSQNDSVTGPTLILTWIPNATLKRNPRSIENSPNRSAMGSPKSSPRRTPKQDYARSDNLATPSPSMSPRDSLVSMGSEQCLWIEQRRRSRQRDDSSLCSEISVGSRDETSDYDSYRDKFGPSNKSQTDSGVGTDWDHTSGQSAPNNEKAVSTTRTRVHKVGVNVNDLSKENKRNLDSADPYSKTSKYDSSSTESEGITPEEQLAAMLKKNKLYRKSRERLGSDRSVSIEMEGDNLVVVQEDNMLNLNIHQKEKKYDMASSPSTDFDQTSLSSDSTDPSPTGEHYRLMVGELRRKCAELNDRLNESMTNGNEDLLVTENPTSETTSLDSFSLEHHANVDTEPLPPRQLLEHFNNGSDSNVQNMTIRTPDVEVTRYRLSSSSTSTSGPDSRPPTPYLSPDHSATSSPRHQRDSLSGSSSCSLAHNLCFPENSMSYMRKRKEKRSPKEQVCGVFSVDLAQMRSLRLFYGDKECTRGQVVIASRESQYKILHFHHSGLDKLAAIFEEWNLFANAREKRKDESPYRQFLIVQPTLMDSQCHPEEGVYGLVTDEIWQQHMNIHGQIEDDFQLRKAIFFGGVEASLRHEAWPFLLHYYPFDSTFLDREHIRNDKFIQYQDIRKLKETMSEEEYREFWRNIQCTVEKDVVRTDRSHPYFKGENNPNIEVLKNILLNYAIANPRMGYTQGMSDLLAPVLAEIQHEVDAYWCFVGLMQRTIFVSSPKDCDMDKQLNYLRELLRLMQPKFYEHLEKLGADAMELLFCHRWILLCFKREFPETDALRIWESCWAHYQTDYFHLFICVAIVSIYGEDVVEQDLPEDEILLHFSSLAMHMNGELVLRKARGLLHQFRKIPKIPCTLHGLCSLCGTGMWDSGHVPTVECVGNHSDDESCPYNSSSSTPVRCLDSD
ncbi:TBC1 domain family member 16 [Acanthosepion pharaonis]|uniref:TBC1 domain family member 16 n=1 Tax=Acanthosepion pharaonis TaxID=158019 RepID=A0A812CX47_ACAPH|nr:TBC1 domain family member 16 [Sepia pharaonis]